MASNAHKTAYLAVKVVSRGSKVSTNGFERTVDGFLVLVCFQNGAFVESIKAYENK